MSAQQTLVFSDVVHYTIVLNDYANHSAAAVIDDLLQGVLKFHLAVFGHLGDFCLDSVAHDLLYAFSKNVGVPQFRPRSPWRWL